MEERILHSTKKILGIGLDDDSFDYDVITHINSALSNLAQLGIAPAGGISVTEENELTWADLEIGSMGFLDDSVQVLSMAKTLVYLRVRMLFDPPTTSYLIDAMQRQIDEHQVRLSIMRETTGWVDPDPKPLEVPDEIIEGGRV